MIIQWMGQFTPLEQDFKAYYDTHRAPITEKLFFELLQKHYSTDSDLRFANLDPTHVSQSPQTSTTATVDFSDALWLLKTKDVSIRKHPRYFPPLIHSHEFIEIAYVYNGFCKQTFYYSNKDPESISLQEGSICIISPRLSHTIEVYDDSIVINILIRTSMMKHTLTNLIAGNRSLFDFFIHTLYENPSENFVLFQTGTDDSIHRLVVDMMLEICQNKAYSQKALSLLLGLFFTYIERNYSNTITFSSTAASSFNLVADALTYIHQNYATTTVDEIAKHFFVSKSYLSRTFKAHMNSTVIETIQLARIQNACEYLANTKISVQRIGELVGYSDVTFFIRTFKKYKKTTPLQYRNQFSQ